MLSVVQWQEYRIGNILPRIVKPPVLHAREVEESDEGIPYIVRSKFNNGVKYRVAKRDGMALSPGGVITFGAENATFFYQDEPFVSGRDIYYIDTRALKRGECLFLVACLQQIAKKYSYNNGLFPELLKQEVVLLPPSSDGQPDWLSMRDYVETALSHADRKLSFLSHVKKQRHSLNATEWTLFPIGGPNGLFRIEKGTRLTRADMLEGETPFIGASTANNGVTAYIGNDEHIHPGNVITVAYNGQKATGKAFYQPKPFWASDDVHVLYPNFELNELRALFLLPIFRIVGEPYAFEDKWKIEFMEKNCLPLPAKDNGTPDWDYIEAIARGTLKQAKHSIRGISSLF